VTQAFVPLNFAPGEVCQFFGGVPLRMVYDNLKAVVEAIFIGKERLLASGWEKGQVENQVGNIREWLFTRWRGFPASRR
jgi:hypothetical protein